jgi:hypothetical protein
MNKLTIARLLPLLLSLSATAAHAGFFGSVETGMNTFENVQAVANEPQSVSGSSIYGASDFVGFHAFSGDRTAALAKLTVRFETFEENELLTNQTLGGEVGLYHAFSGGNSMMLTVGGSKIAFEDQRRDDAIAATRLSYTLSLHPRLLVNTEVFYNQGSEETLNGVYRGQGASTSFNWRLHDRVKLSLGVGYVDNAYERLSEPQNSKSQTLTVEEKSTKGWLGLAFSMSKRTYLLASIERQRVQPDGAEDVLGQSYTLGLGARY